MLRTALAVLAGFLAWTGLFLGLSASIRALFASAHGADGSVFALGPLLLYLALAAAASLLAGYAAGRIDRARPSRAALVTGLVLLAVGLPVQIASWSLAPVWYHLAFLVMLVPLAVVGGRLAAPSR